MTHLTRGRAQATGPAGRAGGARYSQQSFLPVVFLEWALPVLSTARGPPLTRQRGFPQGHRKAAFLAGAWRCTSKKSHKLQTAPGPESVWTGAPSPQAQTPSPNVPEPSTPVHKHHSSLTAEHQLPPAPPPRKAWPQRTGGLAVAPMGKELGFGQTCSPELQSHHSHGRHRQPHCMAVAPLPSPGGAQPPLTEAPEVQLSLCSGLASKFSRKQRRDSGLTASLACFDLLPLLRVWGCGEQPMRPHFASVILEHETLNLLFFFMPLAQHPIGVQTHPFGLPRIQA